MTIPVLNTAENAFAAQLEDQVTRQVLGLLEYNSARGLIEPPACLLMLMQVAAKSLAQAMEDRAGMAEVLRGYADALEHPPQTPAHVAGVARFTAAAQRMGAAHNARVEALKKAEAMGAPMGTA